MIFVFALPDGSETGGELCAPDSDYAGRGDDDVVYHCDAIAFATHGRVEWVCLTCGDTTEPEPRVKQ